MFSLSFVPSDMSLIPENSVAFLHRINEWLPPPEIQFYIAFLYSVAIVTKLLLSPCNYIHYGSMTVSRAMLPEGLKSHAHSIVVSRLFLRVYDFFFFEILCTGHDE